MNHQHLIAKTEGDFPPPFPAYAYTRKGDEITLYGPSGHESAAHEWFCQRFGSWWVERWHFKETENAKTN